MGSNPPVRLNLTGKNNSNCKRTTNPEIPATTSSSTPTPLISRGRAANQQLKLKKPSRSTQSPAEISFARQGICVGLHVEITNQQARLPPSNNTQFTKGSIKQLLSQSKLLSVSISTLVTIQNKQVPKPASPQEEANTAQHARSQRKT